MSPETIHRILNDRYYNLMSYTKLAVKYNVSKSTIKALFQGVYHTDITSKSEIFQKIKAKTLPPEHIERLKELYDSGMPVTRIAETLNQTRYTTRKQLTSQPWYEPKKNRTIDAHADTIKNLYKKGLRCKAIGKKIGYSKSAVNLHLTKQPYFEGFDKPKPKTISTSRPSKKLAKLDSEILDYLRRVPNAPRW